MNAEIFAALAQLEKERGIPQSYMIDKITQALVAAYKKNKDGYTDNVFVEVENNTMHMYVQKEVVDDVFSPATEISLDAARKINGRAQLGDLVKTPYCDSRYSHYRQSHGSVLNNGGLAGPYNLLHFDFHAVNVIAKTDFLLFLVLSCHSNRSLFSFFVSCVLLAESAVLLHFNTIRIVFLILHCVVVSLLAFSTCQCNFNSHPIVLRLTQNSEPVSQLCLLL